jgi:hypothetical protein
MILNLRACNHNGDSLIVSLTPAKGLPLQKSMSNNKEKLTRRLSHLYDASRTSIMEPVSPKRKFSLQGRLQSNNVADMNRCK